VIPADGGFGVSITNARGRHTYPIATFTWLLLPENGTDAAKKTTLRDLSRSMLTAGQQQCQEFGYSPLPPEFRNRELQALSALN
jgi:phosphate transport system substrate-binding protein